MQSDNDATASARKPLMSNRQVIAIFVLGIVMMFVAFWTGLSVIQGNIVSSSNQATVKSANPATPQKAVEATRPPETAAASPAEETPQTLYLVRVAAFGTRQTAEELKDELRKKGFLSAHVQEPEGDYTLYNVNLGPFGKREEAQQVANTLSIEGKKILGIFQVNRD
jgi:cell division septation protein DedD